MRRNIGIDCLRVISMFMVVVLHVQGFTDLINSVEVFSCVLHLKT